MTKQSNDNQSWGAKSKSIKHVIEELKTFENQELTVMVSSDGGETFKPVKLLGKGFEDNNVYCTLFI